MIRLKVPLIPDENVLNSLSKKNIYTVNDFIQKKSSDLQNICNLPCKEITKLKENITIQCSSTSINGYELYLNRPSLNCIQTGITNLDNLLNGGLLTSHIYELCGPSACGKTQLIFSILLNIIKNINKDIIYIDTKNDFCVKRLKQILKNKFNMTNQKVNTILKKIHVYSVLDIYSLIACLHSFKRKFEPIIIIDSLSTLYMSFVGFYKNDGLCYMNHICSILKYLCKNNATVIVTNLAVKNCDFTNKPNEINQLTAQNVYKPAIGKYWLHIPNTRLMLYSKITNRQQQICITTSKSDTNVPMHLDSQALIFVLDYTIDLGYLSKESKRLGLPFCTYKIFI